MKRYILAGLLLATCPLTNGNAQTPTTVPPGTPVTITVVPGTAPSPPASITLGPRHGHVVPQRSGFNHTGAGNIDVAQPTPDVVVVTMTGVAVAGGHPCKDSVASMNFDLTQCFDVNFDSPKLKKAKLVMEARVIGLLRSHKGLGAAQEGPGCATVAAGPYEVLTVCAPAHSVACGENLSINDHDGPVEVPVTPGKYTLHQTFVISAAHPKSISFFKCKAASAEFAPDPALDPLWISYWEPFHGAAKKDFGFQITLKVVEDTSNGVPATPDVKGPAR
jgi:hypothetical protein